MMQLDTQSDGKLSECDHKESFARQTIGVRGEKGWPSGRRSVKEEMKARREDVDESGMSYAV